MKKCRYPKCNKNTRSKNSLFCMDHSREIREKAPSKESLEKLGKIAGAGITILTPIYTWYKNKKG